MNPHDHVVALARMSELRSCWLREIRAVKDEPTPSRFRRLADLADELADLHEGETRWYWLRADYFRKQGRQNQKRP